MKYVFLLVLLVASVAVTNLSAQGVGEEPFLRIGDYMNPEPWHNWIGGEDGVTRVQLHIFDPYGEIDYVEFYYSLDGGLTWELFYTDNDGYEPNEDTYGIATLTGDGWSGYFNHSTIPQISTELLFRAIAYGPPEPFIVENTIVYDPTPPTSVTLNIEDWDIIQDDTVWVDVDPILADIDTVVVFEEEKPDTYIKGIPGISQQPHSPTHCAPTAAAACLKYFEGQGDTLIGGGLGDHDLVDSLAARSGTNQGISGTLPSNLANGIRGWIRDHGNGYTVRGPKNFNWKEVRDELERSQDVLVGVYWDGGGGHRMTMNSIVNTPVNGRYRVDFMDPWTGDTRWGNLDPSNGYLSGFNGAGASGELGNIIIVCPKENDPKTGPGSPQGGGSGPNPPPIPIPLPYPGFWWLRIIIIDLSGHSARLIRILKYQPPTYEEEKTGELPKVFYLSESRPNPFREFTNISFANPVSSKVSLKIYDASGRLVRVLLDRVVEPGFHRIVFDGRDSNGRALRQGIYFVRMEADRYSFTRKLVLIR